MQIKPIKVKAGALQYTIFVAVVIALLVFAFISLSYTQQHFKLKATNFTKVVQQANLAINYAQTSTMPYNEVTNIRFSDNELENTKILKKNWGIFDLISATSSIKKETVTKHALMGGLNADRTALYLQDDNQPLVLVGTTRIEGKTLLPKQGVKRGTIAGNAYAGSQLVYGSVGPSRNKLPVLENRHYLKQLTRGSIQSENNTMLELKEDSRIVNSFGEVAQAFFSDISIDLKSVELIGNIIIKSNTRITVYDDAILKDVILVAPKINIVSGFEGSFQAFASDEIIIGKNCKLIYPSSLTVYDKEVNTEVTPNTRNDVFSKVEVQAGAKIEGVVAYLSDSKRNNYKPQIVLEESAFVTGEVYCKGNVELKGTVIGSVFTKGFIANQFGSIYQNHVYNGKILSADFPIQYSGLLFEKNTKNIAKWLY